MRRLRRPFSSVAGKPDPDPDPDFVASSEKRHESMKKIC